MDRQELKEQFLKIYGTEAKNIFFSPGRTNLIGEHIDYNGGLVMPCAITFGTRLLIAPNDGHLFRFRSLNFDDKADIEIKDGYKKENDCWYNYPLGIINEVLKDGQV